MKSCKICNANAKLVISFGKMPISNAFIKRPSDKEFFYNLSLYFCPFCYMVQLGETVKPEMMFHKDYQFISSTSKFMSLHFKKVAEEIIKKVNKKQKPFIVEIGCNDGIMLKHIAKKKIKHLGIEPSSNVASMARKNKVKVSEDFFVKKTALKIKKNYGQADIIYGANVICHIEKLNSVFEGVKLLLKNDGIFFFEEPYLLDIVKKTSFDQIYDEHIYFFSGVSINNLAKRHGLRLINMKHQDVHGGSMRYYLQKIGKDNKLKSKFIQNKTVKQWIDKEKRMKLDKMTGYLKFKDRTNKISKDLIKLLLKLKKQGYQVVGYGATAKSNTLLNYANINSNLINYISDITPSKIGKYSPGSHIKIKSHKEFVKDKPHYSLLFAWNHKKEIFKKEKKYRRAGNKFIIYFPKVLIE